MLILLTVINIILVPCYKSNLLSCCNELGGTDVRSSRSKKKITPTSSGANSVTSVMFQSDCNLVTAGAADG